MYQFRFSAFAEKPDSCLHIKTFQNNNEQRNFIGNLKKAKSSFSSSVALIDCGSNIFNSAMACPMLG